MKYKKNKTYSLFNYEPHDGMIYAKATDGIIHFYHCHDYSGEKNGETLWIKEGFIDCRLIYRSEFNTQNDLTTPIGYLSNCSEAFLNNVVNCRFDNRGGDNLAHDYCYMLLKKSNGKACIMEMVSKNIILENIDYNCRLILRSKNHSLDHDFCYMLLKDSNNKAYVMEIFSKNIILKGIDFKSVKSIKQRIVYCEDWRLINDEKREDAVLVIWNEKEKLYSLYSIKEGYIFGPINYNEIEELTCGVIINRHIAIENDGYIFDFANYEEDCGVYYNKEKNDYKILLDEVDGIFFTMEEDECDKSIVKLKYENENGIVIYKYYKETGEQEKEFVYEEDSHQWTERDSWDALTDGQYGDYPDDGLGWDSLYDSMGL